MALVSQLFNHSTPSPPSLSGGMLLGASGVSHPPGQVIGGTNGTSSANGSFNDPNGYGQVVFYNDGATSYMLVADSVNGRIQRLTKHSSGLWQFVDLVSNFGGALVGGSACSLIAIDYSRNQIHIAAYDHQVDNTWISVWSLASWPTLNSGNRLRQYGSNALADQSGKAFRGLSLEIDDTYAVVTSIFSPFKTVVWNHVSGALVVQENQVSAYARWATDRAGKWWSGSSGAAAEPGIWNSNLLTLTGSARLDSAAVGTNVRRNRFAGTPFNPVYVAGRVYARDTTGRILGWDAASGTPVDSFVPVDSLGPSDTFNGSGVFSQNINIYAGKMGAGLDADGVPWMVGWCSNADNTSTSQSFLVAWCLGTSTATWSKTGWGGGACILQSIGAKGSQLAGEKFQVQFRKNGGDPLTLTESQLLDPASFVALGTFTGSDVLELKLLLGSWNRLDGHATKVATRNKLSPTNVSLQLLWDDPDGATVVHQQTTALQGALAGGGLMGRLSG